MRTATDPATYQYIFGQTMLRVTEAERSVTSYTDVLGMTLLRSFGFPETKFSLYFHALVMARLPKSSLPALSGPTVKADCCRVVSCNEPSPRGSY